MTLLATLDGKALRATAVGETVLDARSLRTYVGTDGQTWIPTFSDEFVNGLRMLNDDEAGYGWYPRYAADATLGGGGYYPVVRDSGGNLLWGGFSVLPQNGEFAQLIDPRVPEYAGYETFIPQPSSVIIKMQRTPFVNDTQWQPWRSGVFISALNGRGFAQQYGYFEIRMKISADFGIWPAFWMLAKNGYWPPEIDVIERFPSMAPNRMSATTHTRRPPASGGFTFAGHLWDYGTVTYGDHWVKTFDDFIENTADGFHTYGVEWTPTTITYFYDRRVFTSHDTPGDMHQPMSLLVDFTCQYNIMDWPQIPKYMEIDWVRCWQIPR